MTHKNKNLTYTDIANLLFTMAGAIQKFTHWTNSLLSGPSLQQTQQAQLNAQRLANLKADEARKLHQIQVESNKVVITDAKAELEYKILTAKLEAQTLKNLEKRRELESAGLFSPTFQAEGYAEPGDVRRGIPYDPSL